MGKVIDPDKIYSEISAGLKDLEQALVQMSRELNSAQTSRDIALGRNCNVVIHGIQGLFMKEKKQSKGAVR